MQMRYFFEMTFVFGCAVLFQYSLYEFTSAFWPMKDAKNSLDRLATKDEGEKSDKLIEILDQKEQEANDLADLTFQRMSASLTSA